MIDNLQKNKDIHASSNHNDLSQLITQIINECDWSVDKLSQATGLPKILIENICSGKQCDINLGLFLIIVRTLNFNLSLEKNDLKINLANLFGIGNLEKNLCPECHNQGKKVSAERANSSTQRVKEEKKVLLFTIKTTKEEQTCSHYCDIFIPPSSERYCTAAGQRIYKLKAELYDSMMFCKDCNILFDNKRKKIEKCSPIGYEKMLRINKQE